MTNEKLYIITKKLIPFFPKVENMEIFTSYFKDIYKKQNNYFSVFDDESLFKLFVFIYQLSQVDSNLDLDYLISKVMETKIIITFYTDYSNVEDMCSECEGDGEEECDNCGGGGTVECPSCYGDGVDEEGNSCTECDGKGEIDCEWCDGGGSYTCETCSGSGEIEDWENKLITSSVEVSDNPLVTSELEKYEGTTTSLPEDINNQLQKLQSYYQDVMVRADNALEYVEDEKFVKNIITTTKIKGQVLRLIILKPLQKIHIFFNDMM